MRPDLVRFAEEQREIAEREGLIFLMIDTVTELDSGRRVSFLNTMRTCRHRLPSIRTMDYVVCFRGTVHESYEFLELLRVEIDRLAARNLRVYVDSLEHLIELMIASSPAKHPSSSERMLN